jgi:Flp pilus assembly protein CpaB
LRVANLLPIHFPDESLVLGRITILPIPRGEILVPAELAEGCNPNLQLPNMRAVSVQIRTALEIPKSVESGSHLDLFVVRSSPDGKTHTNPVLKNVIVLGVTWHSAAFGSVAGQTPADVILLLSPDDAHKVAVAQSKGRIKLLASGVTSRHS